MNVNGKNISTKAELLQTINEGVNILDYIKDEKRLSQNTLESYQRDINQFKEYTEGN